MNGSGAEKPERPKTQVFSAPEGEASGPAADGPPEVGSEVDDFLLVDELGEGAFARVFLAHQKSLHRPVALKVFTDPSREAETLAQVDHPNIVRVHDQRRVEGQDLRLLYMEYVPGGTLEAVVEKVAVTAPGQRNGRMLLDIVDETLARRGARPPLDSMLRARLESGTWPEVVALLGAHMAVALDFAHSRGVLHRDMKPANVLLDANGRPKLADFNISSATGLPDDGSAATAGGTLPYMAPEQVRAVSPWHEGGPEDLDERTDLYGLGVVLWELLTGELPFPEPPEDAGMQAVIEHLIATRDAGVSETHRTRALALAEPLLVETLLACLAPEPAARPRDGAEVRRRLEWSLDPELRRLLGAPPGGLLCYRSWLCRIPLCGLVGAVLIPNLLLSGLNVAYNVHAVMEDGSQREKDFMAVVGLVNGILFPVGIAIFIAVGWALRKALRAVVREEPTTAAERQVARRRGLRLGGTMAGVILPLWILGGMVFPIWQQLEDGHPDHAAWYSFMVSNALFGVLAATLCFFIIHAIVARIFLPRLIVPGDADAENAARAERVQRRLVYYVSGCVLVPLVSVILLVLRPKALDVAELAFGALGLMGVFAFAASMAMSAQIRRDLRALARALAPPMDRFRAPV